MRIHIRPKTAVIVLTTLTILLIATAVALLLLDLRKRELEHAQIETMSITRMLMEQTEEAFDSVDMVLQGVQERLQTSYGSQFALDSLPVHLLLKTRISGMPQVASLFITDADGNVLNSSREYPIRPNSVADREYFKAFSAGYSGDLFIGNPVQNRMDSRWTLHLVRKLVGPDGRFRGVIAAPLNLDQIEQRFNYMKFDEVRPIGLYLTDGTLVASLPHRESEIGKRATELGAQTLPPAGDDPHIVNYTSNDGARQVLALGSVKRFPLLVSAANDEEVTLASWRETAMPIGLGAGLVCIFIMIVAALLVRELAREEALAKALREADDRYQRTIDSVTDAIVAIDETQTILMFNPAAERMFGLPAKQAIGGTLERLIPERLHDAHLRHVSDSVRADTYSAPVAMQIEMIGLRTDGVELPLESTISQTLIDGKPQLTAVLRDVTQRRRAEAEQRELNRQLRELSASLQNVREQERTRIAHELHDDLGQQLTGLKLDLSWLSNRLKEGRQTPHERIDAMRHLLDTAIAAVRRISTELRPLILDDLGFGEAVAWQVGEFSRRSGIEIVLDLQAADLVTDDALATAFFRIVQESLTNIIRHADATHVDIRLIVDGEAMVLSIRDNGKGIATGIGKGGIGLISMRERATALGGQFTFGSNPGGGTAIEVSVPVSPLLITGDKA